MNYQSVKVFLEIVERNSISGAARSLYISQPSVSAHLVSLEEELGVQLIARKKGMSRITLTDAGKSFIPLAKNWVNAEKPILRFKETRSNSTLRLAASIASLDHICAALTSRLLQRSPGIKVQLSVVESREKKKAIEENLFDIAIIYGLVPQHQFIKTIPFFVEEYILLCPINTPLPEREISLEELDPSFEIAHSFRSKAFRTWHQQHFDETISPFSTTGSMLLSHNHMTNPNCWAMTPANMAHEQIKNNPGKLTYRRINKDSFQRQCTILISSLYSHTETINRFLLCCDEFVQERPYLQRPHTNNYK